ncbi:CotH kinase family protein [Bacteroidales bacterium OttesenSCG-928-A17]|nr:CotH kinase family protein [Bacteroidales bacterium OttesenSCG-928-A17]
MKKTFSYPLFVLLSLLLSIANPVFGAETALFPSYLNTFTLNEKELIKTRNNIFYFSVPYEKDKTSVTLTVNFEVKTGDYQIKINNKTVTSGQNFVFENALTTSGHKVEILSKGTVYATAKLIFTSLPIVQLYSEGRYLSGNFSKGKIRVNEGAKHNRLTGELLNAEMRYRGATAMGFPKKSFAIKLKDESYNSIDREFFGLRNDNYWILDAMAVDPSRMRNRVSTDLWNDFSTDPYYKKQEKDLVNGTRGQYVELVFDDQYWGLYCMTERIDRKQLKLKKYQEDTQTIRGVLYKSVSWTFSTMLGYIPERGPDIEYDLPNYSNNSTKWDGYEVKYPDLEEGEPVDWAPLYNAVRVAGILSNVPFKNSVEKNFDIPVWADYYLFIELILATDNHGKNCYLSIYNIEEDKRMLVTPWDLDGVFGRQWDGSEVKAKQDFTEYIVRVEHGEHNLLRRLKERNTNGFNENLKKKYDELRSNLFSKEGLINRFETYWEMFEQSGAASREYDRWGIDIAEEMNYLEDWIQSRVEYLNEQYGAPAAITELDPKIKTYPNPTNNLLFIENVESGTLVCLYSEMGVCIYAEEAETSSLTIDLSTYPSGRYYLKTGTQGKVIIKI